jgi:hypothetical protein
MTMNDDPYGFKRLQYRHICCNYSRICLVRSRKLRKASIRTAGNPAEAGNLPNINPGPYQKCAQFAADENGDDYFTEMLFLHKSQPLIRMSGL